MENLVSSASTVESGQNHACIHMQGYKKKILLRNYWLVNGCILDAQVERKLCIDNVILGITLLIPIMKGQTKIY